MIQSAHVGIGIFGKEGNQASSFADFAIGKFKYLRRLLFWHGSSFAYNITNFICLIISKAIITGATKLFFNILAGFSASDFVDDFFFICYAIILTQYGAYLWNEFQINKQKYVNKEHLLGFKLSENYAMVRNVFVKRFKRRFLVFMVSTYWASFVCIVITMGTMHSQVNSDGQTLDQYGIGFPTYTCFVIMVHILWLSQIRDWNKAIMIFCGIILLFFPICLTVANNT